MCVFNSYVDYEDVSIMEFHDHDNYFPWYRIFTWYTGSLTLDSDFTLKDKDLLEKMWPKKLP